MPPPKYVEYAMPPTLFGLLVSTSVTKNWRLDLRLALVRHRQVGRGKGVGCGLASSWRSRGAGDEHVAFGVDRHPAGLVVAIAGEIGGINKQAVPAGLSTLTNTDVQVGEPSALRLRLRRSLVGNADGGEVGGTGVAHDVGIAAVIHADADAGVGPRASMPPRNVA